MENNKETSFEPSAQQNVSSDRVGILDKLLMLLERVFNNMLKRIMSIFSLSFVKSALIKRISSDVTALHSQVSEISLAKLLAFYFILGFLDSDSQDDKKENDANNQS